MRACSSIFPIPCDPHLRRPSCSRCSRRLDRRVPCAPSHQPQALVLTAAHEAVTSQRSVARRDDSALAFGRASVVIEAENHPVAGGVLLVSPRRIRVECGIAPGTARRVQDRKPGLVRGIQAPGRDPRERSGRGALALFPIHIEPFLHRRQDDRGRSTASRAPRPVCKRGRDRLQPTWTVTGERSPCLRESARDIRSLLREAGSSGPLSKRHVGSSPRPPG